MRSECTAASAAIERPRKKKNPTNLFFDRNHMSVQNENLGKPLQFPLQNKLAKKSEIVKFHLEP